MSYLEWLLEALALPEDQRERASTLYVDFEVRVRLDESAKGILSSEGAGPAIDAGLALGAETVATPEWKER